MGIVSPHQTPTYSCSAQTDIDLPLQCLRGHGSFLHYNRRYDTACYGRHIPQPPRYPDPLAVHKSESMHRNIHTGDIIPTLPLPRHFEGILNWHALEGRNCIMLTTCALNSLLKRALLLCSV